MTDKFAFKGMHRTEEKDDDILELMSIGFSKKSMHKGGMVVGINGNLEFCEQEQKKLEICLRTLGEIIVSNLVKQSLLDLKVGKDNNINEGNKKNSDLH